MKQDVLQNADRYMKERRRKKWWHKIVISLAVIVVFCTTYALILPAVTMEKQCDIPEHIHTDACFQTEELTCGMEEHIHSEECQSTEKAPEQGNLNMVLPEGAQIPDGYDANYSYIDPDNRFGVMVYASEGALPDNAVLTAELLEQGSEAYEAAQQALTDTVYDGFAALDIHFTVDGAEIEPESSVYVCINAMGLLPEDANADTLAVQHHEQTDTAHRMPDEEASPAPVAGAVTVETVADAAQEIGQVEALDNGTETTADVAAAFEVKSFSTFTVTWQDSYKLILHYVDTNENSILEGNSETALATYSELESVTLSQYANRINHSGYAYYSAYVLLNGVKTTIAQVRYNKDMNKWQYAVENGSWTEWMEGTNYTADVYLSYTAVDENTIVPPENNIYPIDAFNTYDDNTNVILLNPRLKSPAQEITFNNIVNIGKFFGIDKFNYAGWNAYRIERRNGRYQVIQAGEASPYTGVQNQEAYLLLVKKIYAEQVGLYAPTADWPEPYEGTQLDGNGDTVQINWVSGADVNKEQISTGKALAYFTFSPKNNTATASARADDVAAVADSAIEFQLFDYSTKINRPNGSGDGDSWRSITPYFQFRGQQESNGNLQNGDRDNRYDEDGFTKNHATVERTLTDNYPVLDPNRNALGGAKSPKVTDENLPRSNRSLKYLFSSGDGAVTAYKPTNTILQKIGTHYYYNSAYNAVDYDINSSMFRVRNYVERNGSTSTYGSAQKYYDFLPFNYTDGQVVGTYLDDARAYNLESADVNYWFGMRMDVDFYQSRDGKLNGEEMVFHFSGDDDVWVFVDDVLVLDLGGTHGTVTGSINFATGEIKQYLDWNGDVGTEGVTSFSTTIKNCYEAAGKDPTGGWNGNIFADYTKHKLSFFYMERGCAVANCSIDFNLPILPEKSLQVAKTLTANADADPDVVKHLENTMEYKFRVVKADANGNPTDQLLIKKGDSYTISGAGLTANETRTVGEGGYFTLKAGQMAEFANMLARFDQNESVKKYVVQEVLPTGLTGQYQEVVYSVGSDTGTCTNDTTTVETDFIGYNSPQLDADAGNLVNYTNKVDTEKLSTLAITKTQEGSTLNDPEYYYMKVQLGPDADADSLEPISVGTTYFVGEETRSVEQAGIIKIAAGETAQVKLLAGTYYNVEEVADGNGTPLTGNEGYTPVYSNASGTVSDVGTTVNITVTNTFPTGGLELTKIVNNTAGGSTDGEFAFELKFQVGENWKATDYTAAYTTTNYGQTHTGNVLSFTKQQDSYAVATVKLYHGEMVTITGLPAGAQVSIKETNADGYSVGWKINDKEVYGQTVTCDITGGNDSIASVICTNTTGYELPDTGGAGTVPYTTGGFLLLIGAAFLLLYIYISRRKDDSESF
ncbi:LPXTG cell wall anchor domain-containing protein [bacterium]|nr:LPXTG cell wall anchor domain-containing protein [bacterium]MDY4502823.1 LPXTG cell wall anchor domain-containing protein [Bariatricus sp.]